MAASLESKTLHQPPFLHGAVGVKEMKAPHLELNIKPRSQLRDQSFFGMCVEEAQVGHKSRLVLPAKLMASGLMSISKRLRQRGVNEDAAKVFVAEVDLSQADCKRPQGCGHKRRTANHLIALAHAAPQQSYVRGELRSFIPDAQPVEDLGKAIAHLSLRHEPQGIFLPGRRMRHKV